MKKLLRAVRITLPLCLFGGTGIVHAMTGTAPADPDARALLPADANASQSVAPADRREGGSDFGAPVDDAGLDSVRGGFDLGNDLQASLGIEQVTYINGKLVTSTDINIPDIAQITQQQAVALATALSNLNVVVQNGPGNSADSSAAVRDDVATMLGQGASGSSPASTGQGAVATGQGAVATTSVQGASGNTNTPVSVTQASSVPLASISSTNAGASNGVATVSLPGLNGGLATVIQNSLNNQSIRTLTTLNISLNTLQILRNMNLQSTLQSAQMLSLGH
ncbi:hypothetical protein IHE49_18020 [Rhodanobacter sp. 7MK24]|uniref:hypothetical protein n=1 Tax=Rhodanobacter sp. 7MK24 TaxID=2775922 RepID=UPI00177C1B15|nr:hypothetical protein [Rhodanobacter sp. 7MK24]MBD8882382.1 hypothetical protein [Rhodanobacter sp. 7MK24]